MAGGTPISDIAKRLEAASNRELLVERRVAPKGPALFLGLPPPENVHPWPWDGRRETLHALLDGQIMALSVSKPFTHGQCLRDLLAITVDRCRWGSSLELAVWIGHCEHIAVDSVRAVARLLDWFVYVESDYDQTALAALLRAIDPTDSEGLAGLRSFLAVSPERYWPAKDLPRRSDLLLLNGFLGVLEYQGNALEISCWSPFGTGDSPLPQEAMVALKRHRQVLKSLIQSSRD